MTSRRFPPPPWDIEEANASCFIVKDNNGQLRLKAEACRRLADITGDEQREAHWFLRAEHWDELSAEAAKQQRKLPQVLTAAVEPLPISRPSFRFFVDACRNRLRLFD
jgi:hypothetical protein